MKSYHHNMSKSITPILVSTVGSNLVLDIFMGLKCILLLMLDNILFLKDISLSFFVRRSNSPFSCNVSLTEVSLIPFLSNTSFRVVL